MKVSLDITWMPRRWRAAAAFGRFDAWTTLSFGPGESAWTRDFGLVIGRLWIALEIQRYAP